MRYSVQVLETTGLPYRTGPGTTYPSKGEYKTGERFIVTDSTITKDGTMWFQNDKTKYWCIYRTKSATYIKILDDLTPATMATTVELNYTDVGVSNHPQNLTTGGGTTVTPDANFANLKDVVTDIPEKFAVTDVLTEKRLQNSNGYPLLKNTTVPYQYDFTMNMEDINKRIALIKKNLNIPSLYTQPQLNRLNHTQFNRYKIAYPDYERGPLIPYVVFTRPDLNLYDTSGVMLDQLYVNPTLQYLISSNPLTAKSLTLGFSSEHYFNPLLTNRVGSLDVVDETFDTADTGETFTGYKSVYAKHSIRSNTAGTLSIKFPETYNMALTTLHQIWCGYEGDVYRGKLDPKTEYITGKVLDYACSVYYFLMDRDWTIRFWTKYYGVFPSTVNKSIFSYDSGSLVQFPEMNITYNYIYKEDMSPDTIVEFNNDSNVTKTSSIQYAQDHEKDLGHCGPTWAGAPFIQEVRLDEGNGRVSQRFVLRHRVATADSYIDSATAPSGDISSSTVAITGIS